MDWIPSLRAGVLLAASALVVGGCGASAEVSTGKTAKLEQQEVQDVVAKATTSRVGEAVEAACPDDLDVKKGDKFECELRAPDGTQAKAGVTVTAIDENATPPVRMSVDPEVVGISKIKADLVNTVGPRFGGTQAKCPTLTPPAAPLQCQLLDAGGQTKGTFNVTIEGGRFLYRPVGG